MRLHHRTLQHLNFVHIQLDELRTRLRSRKHVLWLWLAIDPISKIIPVLLLGPRTQNAAYALIHTLRQQLVPTCLPVFTSDGLNLYFYALTAHFGEWVKGKGRQPSRHHSSWCISHGGGRTITSSVRTKHEEWRGFRHWIEGGTVSPNGIGSEPPPWQQG